MKGVVGGAKGGRGVGGIKRKRALTEEEKEETNA
jgi:hypothetical protein